MPITDIHYQRSSLLATAFAGRCCGIITYREKEVRLSNGTYKWGALRLESVQRETQGAISE